MRLLLIGTYFLLVAGLLVDNSEASAQTTKPAATRTVGRLADGSPVLAHEIPFNEDIFRFEVDSAAQILTLRLRGTTKNGKWMRPMGKIVQYDLAKGKVLWTMDFTYATNSLFNVGGALVFWNGTKSFLLDARTGAKRWELKNDIYWSDSQAQIAVGYANRPNKMAADARVNTLQGIDLASGEVRWERVIDRTYGWNMISHPTDSTLLVISSGIHKVDLRTGAGWSYDAPTGKKDYRGMVATNAAGLALGVLTGAFMYDTSPDVVRGALSNPIQDSSAIFLATRDELVCASPVDGALVWRTAFPEDVGGASTLFSGDSVLYLVGKGYGLMGQRKVDLGRPFLAAFAKTDGALLHFKAFGEGAGQGLGARLTPDAVQIVFGKRVALFERTTGKLIRERVLEPQDGELTGFVGEHVYVRDTSTNCFRQLIATDTTKSFLVRGEGDILILDEQLRSHSTLSIDSVYQVREIMGEYRLMARGEETVVIDGGGRSVATLDVENRGVVLGEKYYVSQGDRLLVIDLNGVD